MSKFLRHLGNLSDRMISARWARRAWSLRSVQLMLILLFHEMGHFIMTLRDKVPASFPLLIPVPMMLMGTLGAVTGVDPRGANRNQVFDLGWAGLLAGLVLTFPLLLYGLSVSGPVTPRRQTRGSCGPPL